MDHDMSRRLLSHRSRPMSPCWVLQQVFHLEICHGQYVTGNMSRAICHGHVVAPCMGRIFRYILRLYSVAEIQHVSHASWS